MNEVNYFGKFPTFVVATSDLEKSHSLPHDLLNVVFFLKIIIIVGLICYHKKEIKSGSIYCSAF